ncbi:hypothetical protein CXF60_07955 [Psychrobacter sp. 4Bb]|nr:hypothetical protein CXF60_07955 [Psychrobacter sp. 4Bb]
MIVKRKFYRVDNNLYKISDETNNVTVIAKLFLLLSYYASSSLCISSLSRAINNLSAITTHRIGRIVKVIHVKMSPFKSAFIINDE